ncbi:MAG: DUF1836 domain-containing protein [Bacillota bacterium]|nr:DUF1836 domain-containing protein [Bacillota bacterium]
MDVNYEDLINLSKEISNIDNIELSDIPIVDLYMDQLTTLFDDKLGKLKRDDDDKILTKTMVNNYAKAKILTPPKNKKYGKQHIILLILIYNLKQILSLNDIEALLSITTQKLKDDSTYSLEEMYNLFLKLKKTSDSNFSEEFTNFTKMIKETTFESSADDLNQLILTVLMLINDANTKKRMAEKIIDNFFKNKDNK